MLPKRSPQFEHQPHSLYQRISRNQNFEGSLSPRSASRSRSPTVKNNIGDIGLEKDGKRLVQVRNGVFPTNKENLFHMGSVGIGTGNQRDLSPNKLNATRKPMISPMRAGKKAQAYQTQVQSPRDFVGKMRGNTDLLGGLITMDQTARNSNGNVGFFSPTHQEFNKYTNQTHRNQSLNSRKCVNHSQKTAEFVIRSQEEEIQYCNKCATMAASQGFEVFPLDSERRAQKSRKVGFAGSPFDLSSIQKSQKPARYLPNYPELQQYSSYHAILAFLKELYQVESQLFANLDESKSLEENLQTQVENTDRFYQKLSEIIYEMRDQHILDLKKSCEKLSQQIVLEGSFLKDHCVEIDYIRQDIENNLEQIVTKVDRKCFQDCFQTYRSQTNVIKIQSEEILEKFKREYPKKLTLEEVEVKVNKAIDGLRNLWMEGGGSFSSNRSSNINPNLNQNHGSQKQGQNMPRTLLLNGNGSGNLNGNGNQGKERYANQYSTSRSNRTSQNYRVGIPPQIIVSPPQKEIGSGNRLFENSNENFQEETQFRANRHYDFGEQQAKTHNSRDPRDPRGFNSINQGTLKFLESNRKAEKSHGNQHAYGHGQDADSNAFRELFVEEQISPQFNKI